MDKALITELCGCCEPQAASTPVAVMNRPGLTALKYRVGTFSTFREAMLEAIARELALRGLTTRQSDDTAITLLELWAAIADVLTFYQERIANEAFLRTARERDSVLRLARLLDYHLRPGLAATTRLAFTLDEGATVRIPIGLRVMSLPGQDEMPQIFETVEKLTAQAQLNRVRVFPIPVAFNPFTENRATATLLSGPSSLSPGDKLVFYDASRVEEKNISSLAQTDMGRQLAWSPPVQSSAWSSQSTHAAKYTHVLRFFGYNAPSSYQKFTPDNSFPAGGSWATVNAGSSGYAFDFGSQKRDAYPLDARYEEVKPGARLLVDTGDSSEPIRLVTVTSTGQATATKGQLQDTVTQVAVTRYLRAAPAAVSMGLNQLHVFARSGEDTCIYLWWSGSEWETWLSIGGRISSAPAAVFQAPNRIDVFARGLNQAIWHIGWNGSAWSSWESLDGVLSSAPTAASWGANRLDVFARGMDRALYHKWWDGSNWSGWESLGGMLTSAPAAVSWGPNRIDIFARGTDNALWHRWWDGAWHGWESLGGELAGAPAVSSWGVNRLDIFARAADNTLQHKYWSSGWNDWENLGGVLTSDPSAASWGPNRIDIFARGSDYGLQHKSWNGAAWSSWESLGHGMGNVSDLRNARIYQLESPEVDFQPFGYAEQIKGSSVAVPLANLSAIEKGRTVLLQDAKSAGTSATVTGSNLLFTTSVDMADHLAVDLDSDLPQPLDTASAVMLGNVVQATHGETVRNEILGDGDAATAFQKFNLSKKPLTYVPSAQSAMGESTLQVRINGEKWMAVASLYGQPPTASVYTARQTDDGATMVQFGDGVTGARVPSGRGNIIADYRQKLGLEGRLKTGQLNILLDRPVGLKEVLNPAATEGGADPEQLSQARQTAPTTVKTFGRAVSLLDFESLATASGEVAKAKATWVWRGLEKAVHLTVAGQKGGTFSAEALKRLHSGLTQQRDPNHVLLVSNVCRAPILITARLVLDGRYDGDKVKAAATQAILDAFSFEQVEFAQPAHLSDIYRILQDVTGVVGVDIDTLHFKGYTGWTAAQLSGRGASASPLQNHLRIFAARSLSGTTSTDPVVNACFGPSPLPEVLPAEQVYIQSPSADLNLTVVGNLA
jgi:hypothetical protein